MQAPYRHVPGSTSPSTLMYDAITKLIKASSRNMVPVEALKEGWRWGRAASTALTSLSPSNKRLQFSPIGTSSGLIEKRGAARKHLPYSRSLSSLRRLLCSRGAAALLWCVGTRLHVGKLLVDDMTSLD